MGYGTIARQLHWIVAILVLVMMPVGLTMTREDLARPTQDALFILHKNLGPVVFVLVVVRLIWCAFHPAPPLPASVPPAQALAARAVHWGIYALLLVMTLSGYARVRLGGFPIEYLDAMGFPKLLPENEPLAESFKGIHATAKYGVIALILMHVGAAAYHGLVARDGVFGRMWPPVRPSARPGRTASG